MMENQGGDLGALPLLIPPLSLISWFNFVVALQTDTSTAAPPRPVLQASIGSLSSLAPPPAAAPVLNFPKFPNASPIKAVPLKAAGAQKKSRSEGGTPAAAPTPKKPRGRPKKQPELGLEEEEEEEDEMEADLGRSVCVVAI